MDQDTRSIELFRQEAYEHLSDIEDALLDLEETPDDDGCIHRLFRAIHTIKGSGAMFGFDDIADFAHHAETVLDQVREGAVPVTGDLVDLIFMAKDQLKAMLDGDRARDQVDLSACAKIVKKLNQLVKEPPMDAEWSSAGRIEGLESPGDAGKEAVYRIRFRPDPLMMNSGMDPALLLSELRELGHCEVTVHTEAVLSLESLDPEKLYLSWDILLTTDAGMGAVNNIFIFVEESSDIRIQPLDADSGYASSPYDVVRPRLGEILVDRGDVASQSVEAALQGRKRIGELLMASGSVSGTTVESALMEQKILEKRKADIDAETVRISSEKLDGLINLVGEIVVTQAHLNVLAEEQDAAAFTAPIKQMERLTGDLRDLSLGMRMLPVGTLFNRFRRLVRDLSAALGKEVELILEGAQTELDKTILERLHDPLVHLIRNSIDHGQKPPAEREQQGKPRKGFIRLSAAHRGARVNIRIADDGMGIDMASVRAKASEKGLFLKDSDLSDRDLQNLLFTPGFSTARKITCVSGRGVGLDVVKQEISALGGAISIKSTPGEGTTFDLSLPLTLAMIEGLHVKVDDRDFVIPVSQVEMCGELKSLPQNGSDAQNIIRLKNDLIPYIRLRDFFRLPGAERPGEHIVAVRTGHYRIAIVVDEVLGNVQTVIKPLDPIYRLADGISGAAVMGNGVIALIVDLSELTQCVREVGGKTPA